ncbi:MAG TPA: LacI family DNA-binding transcriptional regulator [Capillimicrobium sp.]
MTGAKPPTLRDVARLAEVHVSTASRALDPARGGRVAGPTLERVRAAAAQLGYAPDLVAAGLKRGRTRSVGVIVADFENPFTGPLSRGIASVLAEHDHVALLAETEEDGARLERVLRHFVQRRADAIVVTAAHVTDGDTLAAARAHGVPIVLGIRGVPGLDVPTVLHDDLGGAGRAAEHLLALGHRDLAQLLGPGGIDTFDRRRDGFAAPAARAGVTVRSAGGHAREATIAEGRRLADALLDAGAPPTALFAPSDVMAVGAIDALAARGLSCPADVSIVGYNDAPLVGHLAPPLTTVRLHSEELGRAAGRAALQAIAEPAARPEPVQLPATLVERGSTAPPPPSEHR